MAKNEMMPKEAGNPIMQDTEDVVGADGETVVYERPRYIGYGPYPGNYGFIPQTFEDPTQTDPLSGFFGDGDPIDVVDIGEESAPLGLVYRVKVLCGLGMIDDMGEAGLA